MRFGKADEYIRRLSSVLSTDGKERLLLGLVGEESAGRLGSSLGGTWRGHRLASGWNASGTQLWRPFSTTLSNQGADGVAHGQGIPVVDFLQEPLQNALLKVSLVSCKFGLHKGIESFSVVVSLGRSQYYYEGVERVGHYNQEFSFFDLFEVIVGCGACCRPLSSRAMGCHIRDVVNTGLSPKTSPLDNSMGSGASKS